MGAAQDIYSELIAPVEQRMMHAVARITRDPDDAADAGVTDGCFIEVRSRRGIFVAQAQVTAEIARGTCFVPFHWGRMSGEFKAANNLTNRACDPVSKQAELKFCAVKVRPANAWNACDAQIERALPDQEQLFILETKAASDAG